jgi:hypothetical protein
VINSFPQERRRKREGKQEGKTERGHLEDRQAVWWVMVNPSYGGKPHELLERTRQESRKEQKDKLGYKKTNKLISSSTYPTTTVPLP